MSRDQSISRLWPGRPQSPPATSAHPNERHPQNQSLTLVEPDHNELLSLNFNLTSRPHTLDRRLTLFTESSHLSCLLHKQSLILDLVRMIDGFASRRGMVRAWQGHEQRTSNRLVRLGARKPSQDRSKYFSRPATFRLRFASCAVKECDWEEKLPT